MGKKNFNQKFFENISFKRINESENMLKYCFMLRLTDNISPIELGASIDEIKNWIDECFKETDENCYSFCMPNKSFFDRITDINNHSTLNQDFSLLDHEKTFWKFLFKQHAILSAYDKTRKLIALENPMNTSTFGQLMTICNGINNSVSEKKIGLHYLSSQSIIPISLFNTDNDLKSKLTIDSSDDSDDLYYSDSKRSHTGNAIIQSNKLINNLTTNYNTSSLSLMDHNIQNYKELLQLNNFEFYQYTSGRRCNDGTISNTKHLIVSANTAFKKKKYNQYCDSYKKIVDNLSIPGLYSSTLNVTTNNNLFNLADKIYCRYLLENVFCTSTIDCLYQNIINSPDSRYITEQLRLISKVFLLPNAFSRHYILQMAIDNLLYNFNNSIKFSNIDNRVGMLLHQPFSQSTMTYHKHDIWIEKYNTMINLLQKLIFPIYENYFFVTIWKSIRSHCENDIACLKQLFLLLSDYLNNPDIVCELLSMHKAINFTNNSDNLLKKGLVHSYDAKKLIEPFNDSRKIDFTLYKECILSATYNADTENIVPSFLNLSYINSIQPEMNRSLQKFIYNIISSSN